VDGYGETTQARELKSPGVTISIDDFGAGYSSFSSLRELPFDELKVDVSFVKDCAIDPNSAAICRTALDLAHRFRSPAVAEGVVTWPTCRRRSPWGATSGRA
jgi:EAL domain-containing protein (putative c-di-GMP-specific phosphodiesterase class I)